MPEEPNTPENPTPPEDATNWAESEWSDDLDYGALEESLTATDNPLTQEHREADHPANLTDDVKAAAASDEDAEAEWSDDSAYDSLESALPDARSAEDAATAAATTTEEWDEATFEWDEELAETPPAPPTSPSTQDALSWLKPTGRRLRRVWQRLLAGLRNRIPAIAQLPDIVLSGILIGILVLLLVVLNSVRQPATASSSPSPAPAPTLSATGDMPDTAPVEVEAPPAAAPTPLEAAPVIVDGDRIAKIQSQLTDSSILNAQRVIDSVQADFTRNQLTLVFNGDWYRLSEYDQNQLTQALLKQSQTLEFADLQCVTPEGELLARSPVVGNNVVILQRERPPEVPEPERPRFRIMIDR